jgi:hypothetical protein
MATDDPKDRANWPGVEVVLENEEEKLSPSKINLRDLISLLEATINVLETATEERGLELPRDTFRLTEVWEGSAGYAIKSPNVLAETALESLKEVAETGARYARPRTRNAFKKLYNAASKHGHLTLALVKPGGEIVRQNLVVKPPVEVDVLPFESVTQVYGKVLGVQEVEKGPTAGVWVKIAFDDGGSDEFKAASEEVAKKASDLFRETVRATVVYRVLGETREALELDKIEAWREASNILSFFDKVRDTLVAQGIHLRASDLLRELDSEDEEDEHTGTPDA